MYFMIQGLSNKRSENKKTKRAPMGTILILKFSFVLEEMCILIHSLALHWLLLKILYTHFPYKPLKNKVSSKAYFSVIIFITNSLLHSHNISHLINSQKHFKAKSLMHINEILLELNKNYLYFIYFQYNPKIKSAKVFNHMCILTIKW